ncbi:hypothetical protein Peur_056453 [Populus x canadensis]|uniref:Uncharacterized protein n=1 Tax=Populus trichocarpa TaxID=3694 RepID=B9GVX0_POPTR
MRIPTWTHLEGAETVINDSTWQIPASDDRPEYASIQAILYGPSLFAGHTTADWDIKNVSADSLPEWSTPIPAAYNDHLVTFSQKSRNPNFFLINSNHIITVGN